MHPEEATPRSPLGERSRKAHILDVARHLWAQRSYHSMPLRRIADEAGVALALIDHYFGTKHQLFAQTLEPLAAACHDAAASLQELDPGLSLEDRGTALLRALSETVWRLSREPRGRDVLRLWLMHRYDTVPEVQVPLRQATDALMDSAASLLSKCWPSAPHALVLPNPMVLFGAAADMAVGEPGLDGAPHHDPEEPNPFTVDSMVAMMAAGLVAGRQVSPSQPA